MPRGTKMNLRALNEPIEKVLFSNFDTNPKNAQKTY
jgi:hypothetical protein